MRRLVTCILPAFLAMILPVQLTGQPSILPQQQEKGQAEAPASQTTDSVKIVPIPIPDVPTASNQTFTRIAEWNKVRLTDREKEELRSEVDTFVNEITLFLNDSLVLGVEKLSVREMENLENRVDIHLNQLNDLEEKLARHSQEVQGALTELTHMKKRWELTRDRSTAEETPTSIQERISRVIRKIDSIGTFIRNDLEFLLDQQGLLSDMDIRLTSLKEQIAGNIKDIGGHLFVRNMPGLIPALSDLKDPALLKIHIRQIGSSLRSDTDIFFSDFRGTIIFSILFFLGLLVASTWYKLNFKKFVYHEKVEESEFHMMLIRAPFLSSLFLTSLFIIFLYPDLPHTYSALTQFILMVPTFIFVIRMFHQEVRTWVGLLLGVFLLSFLYEFLFFPDILLRLLLLFLSVLCAVFFIWILKKRPARSLIKDMLVLRLFRGILTVFVIMLAVAAVANLVGAFNLAEFFTVTPIEIFVLALAVFVTTKVTGTLVYLTLNSQWLHKLNFIREDFQAIFRKTDRLLRYILWLIFTVRALRILMVKEAIFGWGDKVLNTGWKIGEVNITPASILIFVFVIWLSVIISRMVTTILKKDVFERIQVARGVPNTIIMLLRIALITGGFLFAAAAAGMELTNLSIVLGAFSVGIGFGLQNIFNNMVSGLILAFERPIKVGDTVQVGELMGTVLTIGLRSSVVRSFDGAEVIVPNGNLISDQMINWTRSDSNRRMDIRVGVAYGTDPEKVLAILLDVASSHQHVDKSVDPRAYFIGFGDSSLDFRLLAWTDIEHRLPTESEIHVAINTRLKEAGIEIPFPQRDLHIRSDATKSPPSVKEQLAEEEKKPQKKSPEDPPAAEGKASPEAEGRKPRFGDGVD